MGVYVNSPRDAIDALAAELVGRGVEIGLDDLGRRCLSRDTARRLLAERAAAEARRAELQRRHESELAERAVEAPRGMPALENMSAYQSMLAAAGDDERQKDRAGDRMLRLMRGESWGATFGAAPDEES